MQGVAELNQAVVGEVHAHEEAPQHAWALDSLLMVVVVQEWVAMVLAGTPLTPLLVSLPALDELVAASLLLISDNLARLACMVH